MDDGQFDAVVRALARTGSRRRLVGGLVTSAAGLVTVEDATAKKQRCVKKVRTPCSKKKPCCQNKNLRCGSNGCDTGTVCVQQRNGPCDDPCDCPGNLSCSERAGNTCQRCSGPDGACRGASDCCLSASLCGVTACDVADHCCQPQDAACANDCQCCTGLVCSNATCTPI
jgi:hypothetical protein